jgi:hypothetical protein
MLQTVETKVFWTKVIFNFIRIQKKELKEYEKYDEGRRQCRRRHELTVVIHQFSLMLKLGVLTEDDPAAIGAKFDTLLTPNKNN